MKESGCLTLFLSLCDICRLDCSAIVFKSPRKFINSTNKIQKHSFNCLRLFRHMPHTFKLVKGREGGARRAADTCCCWCCSFYFSSLMAVRNCTDRTVHNAFLGEEKIIASCANYCFVWLELLRSNNSRGIADSKQLFTFLNGCCFCRRRNERSRTFRPICLLTAGWHNVDSIDLEAKSKIHVKAITDI